MIWDFRSIVLRNGKNNIIDQFPLLILTFEIVVVTTKFFNILYTDVTKM